MREPMFHPISQRAAILIVTSLLGGACVAGCRAHEDPPAATRPPEVVTEQRPMMSTRVSMMVVSADPEAARVAIQAAFAEMDRVVALLNEWKPGTQVSELNAQAGIRPVRVDPEVLDVLRTAREISEHSGGAFDVTVGSLWGVWDFSWRQPRIPDPAELAARTARIDYRKVVLDPGAGTAYLAQEGMLVSLGGIAKGYAVDRASRVLRARGFPNHVVSAGGDLYASGRRPDGPWRVGIRHPIRGRPFAMLEVEDAGVATSGSYERYFVHEGVRYHHILDPETGQPARGLVASTVVAPSATLADAYATAVFVAGPEGGLALARARPELEALVLTDPDLEVRATEGLARRLRPIDGEQAPADLVPVGKLPQAAVDP